MGVSAGEPASIYIGADSRRRGFAALEHVRRMAEPTRPHSAPLIALTIACVDPENFADAKYWPVTPLRSRIVHGLPGACAADLAIDEHGQVRGIGHLPILRGAVGRPQRGCDIQSLLAKRPHHGGSDGLENIVPLESKDRDLAPCASSRFLGNILYPGLIRRCRVILREQTRHAPRGLGGTGHRTQRRRRQCRDDPSFRPYRVTTCRATRGCPGRSSSSQHPGSLTQKPRKSHGKSASRVRGMRCRSPVVREVLVRKPAPPSVSARIQETARPTWHHAPPGSPIPDHSVCRDWSPWERSPMIIAVDIATSTKPMV